MCTSAVRARGLTWPLTNRPGDDPPAAVLEGGQAPTTAPPPPPRRPPARRAPPPPAARRCAVGSGFGAVGARGRGAEPARARDPKRRAVAARPRAEGGGKASLCWRVARAWLL